MILSIDDIWTATGKVSRLCLRSAQSYVALSDALMSFLFRKQNGGGSVGGECDCEEARGIRVGRG